MVYFFAVLALFATIQLWGIRRILHQLNTNYCNVETARAQREGKR